MKMGDEGGEMGIDEGKNSDNKWECQLGLNHFSKLNSISSLIVFFFFIRLYI